MRPGLSPKEEALTCYRKVLAVLRDDDALHFESKFPNQSADAYLGIAFQLKTDITDANDGAEVIKYMIKARDIHHVTGNKGQEALVLASLGDFYCQLGQLGDAEQKMEEALQLRASAAASETSESFRILPVRAALQPAVDQ